MRRLFFSVIRRRSKKRHNVATPAPTFRLKTRSASCIRALSTRAEKVAGGYRLRGSKLYISNAPFASFLLVAARTRPELASEAISLFLVDVPNPAVSISKLTKEGIRASETGLIAFDDVFVPEENLLGAREGIRTSSPQTLLRRWVSSSGPGPAEPHDR